ncbi:MAG: hypothetical protein QM492_04885 [Rhodobacterales bacterium]
MTQDPATLNQTSEATPIKGPTGLALAAIQVSVFSRQWSNQRIQNKILPHIIEAKAAVR